jgi:hypothetical protein
MFPSLSNLYLNINYYINYLISSFRFKANTKAIWWKYFNKLFTHSKLSSYPHGSTFQVLKQII